MKTNCTGSCLYLFTDHYPYGKHETFLETEINYLADAFDSVRIIPRRMDPTDVTRGFPENVKLRPALFDNHQRRHALLRGLSGQSPWYPFVLEFLKKKVYLSPKRCIKWLEAWCVVRRMLSHPDYPFNGVAESRAVLYFYWGVGSSWAIPFLPDHKDAVVRYHGHDLYEDRGEYYGYMPFRAEQLKASRLAACVSEHGFRYLHRRYDSTPFAAAVHRLGVQDCGVAHANSDKSYRIITCSRLVPLKRLDLLIDALAKLDFPVCWTHIGDGPMAAKLKKQAAELPMSVRVNWVGSLPNTSVRRYYLIQPQDVFVNVSMAEGAPVAIMEALNVGLPVLATDAGATRELFDGEAGRILPVSITADGLAHALRDDRAASDRNDRRRAARRCWAQKSNAAFNYPRFCQTLLYGSRQSP